MSNVFISYFNGEVIFWDRIPKAKELPLHALFYRYEPSKFACPLLYRVHISVRDTLVFRPIMPPIVGAPAELKAAALLMGAPFPE